MQSTTHWVHTPDRAIEMHIFGVIVTWQERRELETLNELCQQGHKIFPLNFLQLQIFIVRQRPSFACSYNQNRKCVGKEWHYHLSNVALLAASHAALYK